MDVSPHILRTSLKFAAVGLAACFAVSAAVFPTSETRVADRSANSAATPTPRRTARRTTPRRTPTPKPKPKYSEFSHDVAAHKVDCSQCHTFPSANWNTVRTGDTAFPDVTEYPKHDSCVSCHKQQFFRGSTPMICSICHTKPGPRNSERHPFPNPREIFDTSPKGKTAESDFEISFPHATHIEIVSQNLPRRTEFVNAAWASSKRAFAEESCAVCHKTISPQGESDEEYFTKPPADIGDAFWLKKGTFKSSPTGHTTCFTCHSADSGMSPAPTDCATCHKLKQPSGPADFDAAAALRMGVTDRVMLDAWKTRRSAGTFRHEFMSHAELSCATCHNAASMVTTDLKTRKVEITSCNMCHITATADDGGVLNLEIEARKSDPKFTCVKCHVSFGSRPVPQSHIDAVAAAGN